METPNEVFSIEELLPSAETTIAKDLKLNLSRILQDGRLNQEEALLGFLAVSRSVGSQELVDWAKQKSKLISLPPDVVREAEESAAIMAMLNTYYRFRHMVGKEDDYRVAGLRMTSLANPIMGKERFEMLAFAVSVINGCESCIRSHEKILRESGVAVEKVHDLVRLAAVVRAVEVLRAESHAPVS